MNSATGRRLGVNKRRVGVTTRWLRRACRSRRSGAGGGGCGCRRSAARRRRSPAELAGAVGGGAASPAAGAGALGDRLAAAAAGRGCGPVAVARPGGRRHARRRTRRRGRRGPRGACARPGRGSTMRPLVPGGDALVVVEVLGGGVGLLRLVERQVERLVDHLPAVQVRPVDEGDRDAGGAGAAGAADPVDVGLVVLGAGVVDDVRDAGDVDAAGGDVGGDQDADLVLAELRRAPSRGPPGPCRRAAGWRRSRARRGRRPPAATGAWCG